MVRGLGAPLNHMIGAEKHLITLSNLFITSPFVLLFDAFSWLMVFQALVDD